MRTNKGDLVVLKILRTSILRTGFFIKKYWYHCLTYNLRGKRKWKSNPFVDCFMKTKSNKYHKNVIPTQHWWVPLSSAVAQQTVCARHELNQQPPMYHPSKACYDSVVNEPNWIHIRFHLVMYQVIMKDNTWFLDYAPSKSRLCKKGY